MDILRFQSRCRDLSANSLLEGMKLQEKRRKFQSRYRDYNRTNLLPRQEVCVLTLRYSHYHR